MIDAVVVGAGQPGLAKYSCLPGMSTATATDSPSIWTTAPS